MREEKTKQLQAILALLKLVQRFEDASHYTQRRYSSKNPKATNAGMSGSATGFPSIRMSQQKHLSLGITEQNFTFDGKHLSASSRESWLRNGSF